MNTVRDIPWPRILAEGAAIVVSILLAFWIQTWWDENQEERQLHEILEALEEGFSGNLSLINESIETVSANYELLNRFIQIGPEDIDNIPMGDRFRTLRAMWVPDTRNCSSDKLYRKLREELRTWPAKLTWISKALAEDFQFTSSVVDPYFRNNLSLLQLHGAMTHRPGDPTYVPKTPDVKPKELVSHISILADTTFQNILAQRHDLLNEIINLAREPELPQQLDQTIELLRMEIGE